MGSASIHDSKSNGLRQLRETLLREMFDQVDIIAALTAGKYLTGPYAVLAGFPAPGVGVENNQTTMTSVPEPSAVAILVLGLAGMLATRRPRSR